jgi:hypothetical protein
MGIAFLRLVNGKSMALQSPYLPSSHASHWMLKSGH